MSSVHTVLLDFSIDPEKVSSAEGRGKVVDKFLEVVHESLTPKTQSSNGQLSSSSGTFISPNVFVVALPEDVLLTIRFQPAHGLITLNVEYPNEENQEPLMTYESSRELERSLIKQLHLHRGHAIPPVKRSRVTRHYPSADERIIEYDVDKVLFEKQSPFQKVQIVHTNSVGNMLVLDELQNLAEADLIYTETLMGRGIENYEGKDVCILGGGDGALLYELLKENPKHVVMLEIDEMVMVACNQHMRSVCGDVLEKRKGDNYEIIVGDCLAMLNKYISEGKKFDFVFGDLTDIPICETPTGEIWDFIRTILDASFKVLKEGGKFMTHGNGVNCPSSLRMYEEQLEKLQPPVQFTTSKAFVPSFHEDWMFYQVTRKE